MTDYGRKRERLMNLKPVTGGFLRPFGTAWFIMEFLKGNGPENSKQIDPEFGAPMTDIHFEYKSAMHRAYARDLVEREEERRIRKGQPAYTEEEYDERLQYYLSRIPYKLLKMRYSSFTRYFGHLKRLGWVKETDSPLLNRRNSGLPSLSLERRSVFLGAA
jgi:hypothetical protein